MTPDPDCGSPQKFEFKPVIWQGGQIHELPIPSGDREGFASGILLIEDALRGSIRRKFYAGRLPKSQTRPKFSLGRWAVEGSSWRL